MSDEINIDCTADEMIRSWLEIAQLREQLSAERRCELRLRELAASMKTIRSTRAPIRKRLLRCITELERMATEHKTATALQLDRTEVAELRTRCEKLLRLIVTCLDG